MAIDKFLLLAFATDLALGASAPSTHSKRSGPVQKPKRFAKLDNKPLARPRGRHAAAACSDVADDDARQIIMVPVNQRLGFRVAEFAALIGVSNVTIWRGIKSGTIDIIDLNGIKIVPRSFAIRAGYISQDDKV
jgi:hypothetical protein